MKTFFYGILARIAWWTRKPPAIGSKFMTGYGRVNWWASGGRDALREDIIQCAVNGVAIYTIEMAGWAETGAYRKAWGNDTKIKEVVACYELAVKLCRTFGMWLHVSIVNDNMGLKKYGDPGIFLRQVMDEAQALCQVIKRNGPANVLIQPVGETQTSAGVAFTEYCKRELGGFLLCNNNRSKPLSATRG